MQHLEVEMPGKELSDLSQVQTTPPFALLKSHKAFPRRQAPLHHTTALVEDSLLQQHEEEQSSLVKSTEIESWIPEPDVIHLTLSHSLPLTPPENSPAEEGRSWIDGPLSDDNKVTTRSVSSGVNTPVVQRSPPTPETTPPGTKQQLPALHPPTYQRNQSGGTRTDSFKTAREDVSSDDDGRQIHSPSMQPSRQKWLRQTAHAGLRDIGLGLGLESEDDDTNPLGITPNNSPSKDDLFAFDGSWGASKDDGAAVGHSANAASTPGALLKKKAPKRPRVFTNTPANPSSISEGAAPLAKLLSLRQRLEQRRQSPASASTERFAEEISWPLQDNEGDDLPAKVDEADNRRFSQMSGTSTVEAMVIDTPPPMRRQTLRHTGKIVSLDSPSNGSRRSSVVYKRDQPHRRQLRHTGSPEQLKRASIVSDVSFGMTTGRPKGRQNSIPVIVIPERKSSLRSSAPSSRRLSRTTSLTSRQQSSRPTTAPDEKAGYFDIPPRERRTMSAVIPSAAASNVKESATKQAPPAVMSENTTMSANTSRKVSRAASTHSASGISFNEHPAQPQPVTPNDEAQEAQSNNVRSTSFDKSTMAEWTALRPRSTQVTPFSLRSAHSSTPGTLEVNEATAISIYPHTNKSILVVQQLPRRDSQPAEHSAIVASNASFAIPGAHAPAVIHQARARNVLDSPLRNPREPPQPPDFKVIPPTPVPNLSPVKDNERTSRQSASNSTVNRLSRPITMVKRALSARRYSENFVSPLTRGFTHRTTVIERRRSHDPDLIVERDNKLHPFWRPRGFWDDFADSDSDSEFGNSGYLVGNSLGMPATHTGTKITAQQPPRRSGSLTQRLSNSMRFSRRNSINRRHSIAANTRRIYQRTTYGSNHDANRSYEFIQPQPDPALGSRQTSMPRLGYQVHFVGLKGLAEKMEKRKERRGEEKREKVRQKLRGSIGPVVPVQGGPQGWGQAGYVRGV